MNAVYEPVTVHSRKPLIYGAVDNEDCVILSRSSTDDTPTQDAKEYVLLRSPPWKRKRLNTCRAVGIPFGTTSDAFEEAQSWLP